MWTRADKLLVFFNSNQYQSILTTNLKTKTYITKIYLINYSIQFNTLSPFVARFTQNTNRQLACLSVLFTAQGSSFTIKDKNHKG